MLWLNKDLPACMNSFCKSEPAAVKIALDTAPKNYNYQFIRLKIIV